MNGDSDLFGKCEHLGPQLRIARYPTRKDQTPWLMYLCRLACAANESPHYRILKTCAQVNDLLRRLAAGFHGGDLVVPDEPQNRGLESAEREIQPVFFVVDLCQWKYDRAFVSAL